MGGVSATARKEASLVGREEELSRLKELVPPPYPEGRVMKCFRGNAALGAALRAGQGWMFSRSASRLG